jgi:mutator protein MutT
MDNKKVGVGFGVMILKNNKILLGLRNEDAEKASSELHGEGTWTMPGGKLHYGETFEQGAIREVNEETGIDVKEIEVSCVQNDMNEFAHFVTIGLIATKYSGEPKTMEPDEIIKWEWFDLDQLPSNLYFPSKKCIEKYKSGLFYKLGI